MGNNIGTVSNVLRILGCTRPFFTTSKFIQVDRSYIEDLEAEATQEARDNFRSLAAAEPLVLAKDPESDPSECDLIFD